ncbi:MAG TPA: FISUMP domain-containing protein [Candidatus Pacearchaeota archaeon]|nr:FISUMP domain-containing protein [Candidatus Pacearchaeota archaeon]
MILKGGKIIKKRNKKGLSAIVATLIIILLTIVAVTVVWVVIKEVVVKNSEKNFLNSLNLNLKIQKVQITCDEVNINLKRNAGEGEFIGLNFVVEGEENSDVFTVYAHMNELESRIFNFVSDNVTSGNISRIKVIPIFETKSGKEFIGEVKDTYILSSLKTEVICMLGCGLPAPNALNAINITNDGFIASWNSVPLIEEYYLDVARDSTFVNLVFDNLSVGDVLEYTITGLDSGTLYYYRIRGYNGTCFSTNSNTISVLVSIRYGLLYNWFASNDSRGIANDGWHMPTISDFYTLMKTLDSSGEYNNNFAGGGMKETGFTYWNSPNTNASDFSGFNGRGAGRLSCLPGYSCGAFSYLKSREYFWNKEESSADTSLSWISYLSYNSEIFQTSGINIGPSINKHSGLSIRLINDTSCTVPGQTGIYTGNDGKIYRTICIGNQEWLADNLAETKYRNGDIIPEVTDSNSWGSLSTGALCAYNNNWDYV